MQAGTTTVATSTGSKTIADLLGRAAEQYADRVAARHKVDGAWVDVTYAQAGEVVREIGLGLIALGIQPGERVCLLAKTRVEWTYCDFAIASAGAVAVPIYATNSPEECEWVAGNSESVAVICEDAAQVAKIVAVRDRLPDLRTIVVIDPAGDTADAVPLDEVRARGRERDPAELEARAAAVAPDGHVHDHLHVGDDRPAEGLRAHPRQLPPHARHVRDARRPARRRRRSTSSSRSRTPSRCSSSCSSFDVGDTIAYFGGDPNQIVAELQEIKPTYLPSVPRIFEKVYTLVMASQPEEAQAQMKAAAGLGVKVRDMVAHGQPVPPELQEKFDQADEQLFKNVRAVFGGRLQHAVSGAAPIAPGDPRVLLRLRRPGPRGLRHDRDLDGLDVLDDRGAPLRLGRQAPARRRGPHRRGRRAAAQGPEHLPTATTRTTTRASARRSTAGCTPATSRASTRTATSSSPGGRRTSSSRPAARTSRPRTSRTT